MRVCQECGKKCRKKFRMRKGYMGKDRYHKLLVFNEDHIVVKFVVICQECMGWNGEKIFCGMCLDINPLCGFHKTDGNYTGICNDCMENEENDIPSEFLLNILIASIISKYRECEVCSRICNEEIIKKEDLKDKNKLHNIKHRETTDEYTQKHKYICERCFGWEEVTNIYCSVCGCSGTDIKFVNNRHFPSVCLECRKIDIRNEILSQYVI